MATPEHSGMANQRGGGAASNSRRRRSLMMKISISAKCNIEQRHFHQIISDTDQQPSLVPSLCRSSPLCSHSLHSPSLACTHRTHLSVGTVLAIFISGRQRRHKMSVTCGLRATPSTRRPLPPPAHCFSGYSYSESERSAHRKCE